MAAAETLAPTPTVDTVQALIDTQAQARPDAVYALTVDGSATLNFGQLARDARSVAAWLRANGSVPGDVVSVVMPNGLMTLRILLGAMAGGWCVNPVNLLAHREQMAYVLKHSDCTLVFVSPDREELVRDLLATIGRDISVIVVDPDGDTIPAAMPDAERPAPPAPDAMALLMYTSGTTGAPKGVMLSQANLCANARAISEEHALTSKDRVLAVLPLCHINAFVVTMLAPLAHGGSLVLGHRSSRSRGSGSRRRNMPVPGSTWCRP